MKQYVVILVIFIFLIGCAGKAEAKEIVDRRGGEVSVLKYDDDSWELQVGGKPYFIKGVVFVPVKVGEDPSQA
ncbi:MAG: hypothetical protein ACI9Y8_001325 [Candidatus Omnitrophota bacterium]|jgi:hypothetical protein